MPLSKQDLSPQPVSVACQDLCYSVRSKTILRHINLLAEPGELLVVVGPSGAGKTTLLNNICLRSKQGTRLGKVLLNGQTATARTFRETCSYVATDARMLPYLTVYETLMTAAKLKLPTVSKKERVFSVERVITELGLTKCRNTYIGGEWKKGISTGERKRVCIAIELLNQPSVLVLDEPTSGLDSTLALELLSVLGGLANSGRTVICSIHQPTSQMWNQLDKLLFLSCGSVMYYGKADDAKSYYSRLGFECPKNYNPADYILSLISPDDTEDYSIATSSRGVSTMEASLSQHSILETPTSNSGEKEIFGGLFPSTGRPVADLNKLIKSFENSKEAETLVKRIDAIQMSVSEPPHDNNKLQMERKEYITAGRSWSREVKALCWRSFKNSIRNPIVCCVMLLVQALQGIILGGIFWQLSSDVAGQVPYQLNTKAMVENPWAQLFIEGIDGKQPLLEALENGVDGRGSQPLLQLLRDEELVKWLRRTVSCAVGRMNLEKYKYPNFGVRPDSEPLTPHAFIPAETVGNILGLLQQLDYQNLKRDLNPLYETLNTNKQESSENNKRLADWAVYSFWITADILNPVMGCAGYLEQPAGRRLASSADNFDVEKIVQSNKSESLNDESIGAAPRQLITVGDMDLRSTMSDIFGVGTKDFVDTTKVIVDRLRTCQNSACKRIGEKYNEATKLIQDAYTAVMCVINILGALFFMVANLGFASYDALLTFPQERVLFNQESANGLYRTSSYFLAKNLADLPFQLIPSFTLVAIYYLFIGIGGTAGQYFVYFATCSGMTFAAYGFGYLVSAASPRMEIAVLIAPVILVIWLTIAGFFLRDEQIPTWISWFSYCSFYKWGFFSLVANQFPPNGYFGMLPNRIPLIIAGITDERLWATMLLLFCLGFAYRILAYCALRYTHRHVGLNS